MSKVNDFINHIRNNGPITLQGGKRPSSNPDLPTVFLRETKRHRKEKRPVVAILASTERGMRIKDAIGEVWDVQRDANGNFKALV